MLSFFKKKEEKSTVNNILAADGDIVAVADGNMIPIEDVNDEVFAQKMMGDGVAFELKGDVVYAPCNGVLEVAFPTGHAYGITMKDGTGLLVHVGINTVDANGDGFKSYVEQGQQVKAGDPLVKLDMKKLSAKYDMTTMLIVTEPGDKAPEFIQYGDVAMGQKVNM